MSTKTEERIKAILKEYYEEKQTNFDNQLVTTTSSIFLWGFCAGVVLSHTGLLSTSLGFLLGYAVCKKNIPIINTMVINSINMFDKSRKLFQ